MSELALKLIEENKSSRSTVLDLSDCDLEAIPQEITSLVWLEELTMRFGLDSDSDKALFVPENPGTKQIIPALPRSFGDLRELKKLALNRNNSTSFKSRMTDEFPVLDLSEIGQLSKLKSLTINFFRLADLSFLSGLKGLEKLSLDSNQINDISPLRELTALIELTINENNLSDLSSLANLTSLRILHFKDNSVKDIAPLARLVNLENLHFDVNAVVDITPLSDLLKLETLSFNFNQVTDISPLSNLVNLQEVKFSINKVKALRPLLALPLLKKFYSVGCPIEDSPSDVCESGDPLQLRAYFEAQDREYPVTLQRPLKVAKPARFKKAAEPSMDTKRDVKLIILGNTNTGKSNLVEYLTNNACTGKRKSTHGMEVHRWIPDAERFPVLKDIAVSTWDFGGQEYYHGAYRLFLSANAVYVLLWCNESNLNGRRKTRLEDNGPEIDLEHFEIKYWLDTIRHYSGGKTTAPLILVQNKTDDPDVDKIRISQELHQEYSIRDSFHISLVKGADKNNIRQYKTLSHFLSELEFIIENSADKATIPPHWQQIRNEILSLKESKKRSNLFSPFIQHELLISLSDFEKACNGFISCELTPDEVYTLPRWLDRGGAVVFFPDIPRLQDKLFLRPDLLAEKIYKILNQEVFKRGGVFMIDEIFDRNEEPLKNIFLEIALHLELIFHHPVKGMETYYLAPQYLPDSHPVEELFKIASKGAWQSAFWVKVPLFHYKKILNGLLIYFAADPQTECSYFWKHGIMFLKNDLRVLIKGLYPGEHEHEGTILIGVEKDAQKQSPLQKEIFEKLLEILKAKNTSTAEPEAGKKIVGMPANTKPGIKRAYAGLLLSYDGTNFVRYTSLLENETEPKIKADNNNTWLMTKHFAPLLPFTPPNAKRVFLSYSHQNTVWLGRLRTHLAGLRRSQEIETWDDKEILPGDTWDATIKKNLEDADVIILLLSADFIASDYIWYKELSMAFQKLKDKSATVISVLLEPFDLDSIPAVPGIDNSVSFRISDFEIIPKNNDNRLQAVSLWQNQEEALAKVAARIREAIKKK